MCLGIAIHRPDDVLARGEHEGFEWMVIHNGIGYRCGYVRIPAGHPWHGLGYNDFDAEAHGGLTFAEADLACDKGGTDDAWWVGFDCAHAGDAADYDLPGNHHLVRAALGRDPFPNMPRFRDAVRTQGYVESECRSLCEQAARAATASV